jgi:hypothetical protein
LPNRAERRARLSGRETPPGGATIPFAVPGAVWLLAASSPFLTLIVLPYIDMLVAGAAEWFRRLWKSSEGTVAFESAPAEG